MFTKETREWIKMTEKKLTPSRKALQARKRAKHKKPEFLRSESWRYSKLSESWRRPRGLDHKMRRKIKGWPPMVSTGYKGPKIARGLHPSGYREVMIYNVQELSKVDPSTQVARIGHTVGKRKRAEIIAEAKEKKIKLLNAKEHEEVKEEGEEEGEETTEELEEELNLEETEEEAKEGGEAKVEKPKREETAKKAPAKKSKPAKATEKPKAKPKRKTLGERLKR
jgi:large subunit ribosomal protein L32e